MARKTSSRSMIQRPRPRCRIGRRSETSAAMAIGLAQTRTLKASRHERCMRATGARLARCMGMIMPARGSAKFQFQISRAFGARSAAPAGRCEMLAKTDTPHWIAAILSWRWLLPITRIALTSAYLIGGIQKVVDFSGAVTERAHFGMQPASLWAVAAIIIELAGSLLVIFGRWAWRGAGGLGVLTAVAMFIANNFWTMTGHDRSIPSRLPMISDHRLIKVLVLSFLSVASHAIARDVAPASPSQIGVGAQYDTTHVYVAPEDVDRFVASFLASFGGQSTKQVAATVTPTSSSTTSQLLQTSVGTVSVFGFKTPIPYPFGAERTGYLAPDLDKAITLAKPSGADIVVASFPDPIGGHPMAGRDQYATLL